MVANPKLENLENYWKADILTFIVETGENLGTLVIYKKGINRLVLIGSY